MGSSSSSFPSTSLPYIFYSSYILPAYIWRRSSHGTQQPSPLILFITKYSSFATTSAISSTSRELKSERTRRPKVQLNAQYWKEVSRRLPIRTAFLRPDGECSCSRRSEGAKEENVPFAVTQEMDKKGSTPTMFYITKTDSEASFVEMTGYTAQRKKDRRGALAEL